MNPDSRRAARKQRSPKPSPPAAPVPFNVLYAGGSAAAVTTPLCGGVIGAVKDDKGNLTDDVSYRDNIFTASGDPRRGSIALPDSNALSAAARLCPNDSFLRGPRSR